VLERHPSLRNAVEPFRKLVIHATEEAKSFAELGALIEQLIRDRFTKKGRLVAVGGGIVQDITAFTASILFRGVGWVFFPTTLLAQCDSCIGSKTSINVGSYKNQLGNFWPPRAIFIDLAFLDTLGERDIRSGLGEMLHYFLVTSDADVQWAEANVRRAFTDRPTLERMIHRSLEIKKAMVERDEFDEGPRNVFNYGHSFGHALESTTSYDVPHGIAVSFGMDLANCISVRLGLMGAAERNRLRGVLSEVWGATSVKHVGTHRFLEALKRDKKNEGNDVKVILTKGIGQMFKTTLRLDDDMTSFIASYFATEQYARPL
jgi:3-dehydroquinate synthase